MTKPYSAIPKNAPAVPASFHIEIPESQLEEFKILLKYAKIPSPTYESAQEDGKLGISHKWLSAAKDEWLNRFDWRKSEANINSFPNFKAKVKGENDEDFEIHFVGLFSERDDAIPVLLLHGWPGSFLEFLPLLQLMKDEYTPATLPYHLIVPGMPGYGFSTPPPIHREVDILEVPAMYNQLMVNLGFGKGYIAQGGDIGSRNARIMAVEHEACKAIHLNLITVNPPDSVPYDTLSEKEKAFVARNAEFPRTGSAYFMEHRTKPATIGLVLSSSPLALLAWIGEKFLAWSDTSPSLHSILESVTLYWFTESGARALYPYRHTLKDGKHVYESPNYFVKKPLGYSVFPKEIAVSPRSWVETTGQLVWFREHDAGGHFAALEQPELFKRDLEDFIGQVWEDVKE